MLVVWAGIHIMLVRIANRKDTDLQKQTDVLIGIFRSPNFRTFTVILIFAFMDIHVLC